jgi:CubicO group peptidase (beta-lactamase class C family)
MKKTLILSLAISLISFAGCSQNFDKAKLDTYFDTLAENNKFMGSIAAFRNGEIIYAKSVGYVDVEQGLKANENSKYRIGSISKTFTTVLVFKAIEEGKLDLNQTIDKFFPTIPNADKITIEHLLYHRSGIFNYSDNESFMDWRTEPKTEQEMIEVMAKGGSNFEPDSEVRYSNSGFVLLSYILEKIYEKPYAEILDEKIIKPIGLKNTYYGKKINIKDNESNSYEYTAEGWEKWTETDMSIPKGDGGIVSTPIDLTLFGDALFNGKLISMNSLNQMKTMKDGFGMGIHQMPFNDKTGFGHMGRIDGFYSVFEYFPDENISFACTANGLNYNFNNISIAILSAVFNVPYEIPKFKTYYVSDEDLDKYLGVYSNEQIPGKTTITKANGKLICQSTGQSSFPLEATDKDKFESEEVGVILEFNPTDKTMVGKQGGGIFNFERE